MPIIKQAIKRVRQDKVRTERNKRYKSHMKSMIKLLLTHIQKNEIEKAQQVLPQVVSAIDTSAKKNLIHKKNAAHKKSRLQKALNSKQSVKKEKSAEKSEKPVASK